MLTRVVDPYKIMDDFCDLKLIDCGQVSDTPHHVYSIFGSSVTESSFKSILGFGILLLAKEQGLLKEGQAIIESTSGSMGVALAQAAKIMGHPVHLVTDINIPLMTRKKLEMLGAELHFVYEPDPVGGLQGAREVLLNSILTNAPDMYFTNQNNNPLNPQVYQRWLIPALQKIVSLDIITAGVFCVGTGGHFVALAKWLKENGKPSYVAERNGSITFGGEAKGSILRGAGNQNVIPRVIGSHLDLVADVLRYGDDDALDGVRMLAKNGLFVGGTSGLCVRAAVDLVKRVNGNVLTFFPDRGELYTNTIYAAL